MWMSFDFLCVLVVMVFFFNICFYLEMVIDFDDEVGFLVEEFKVFVVDIGMNRS